MKKAIVIGASSGIGRTLALVLSQHEYTLGIAARRIEKLRELQTEIGAPVSVCQMDIARPHEAIQVFQRLIQEMGGVDLVVICAGTGYLNPDLEYTKEQHTIDVNVSGFVAMADAAFHYFMQRGAGHLVGVSSIGALRGSAEAPAYSSSKAFVSVYLQSLRRLAKKKRAHITVTEIQPGFVDTAMAKSDHVFWLESVHVVAEQIYAAIRRKKKHMYVTRKWRLIAWVFKLLPR